MRAEDAGTLRVRLGRTPVLSSSFARHQGVLDARLFVSHSTQRALCAHASKTHSFIVVTNMTY